MNQKDLRKAQLCQLEIAKEVRRLCDIYNIRYFLGYGSMLGAVRHSGFIPWDDDLDICLLRSEFDLFIEACKESLNPDYFLQVYETDDFYTWPYAKLQKRGTVYKEAGVDDRTTCGIFIDVFPIENVPNNAKWIRIKYKYYLRLLQIKNNYCVGVIKKYLLLKILAQMLSMFYSKKFLQARVKSLATLNKDDTSTYVYNIHSPYSNEKEIMLREWFEEFIEVNFEKERFVILKNYDAYLKQLYGDYTQLPPISERENRHQIIEFNCNIVDPKESS